MGVSEGSAWTTKGRAFEGRKELDGRVELLHNAQGREQRAGTLDWAPGRPTGKPRQGDGEEGAEGRGTGATETCERGRGRGGACVKAGTGAGRGQGGKRRGRGAVRGARPGGWAAGGKARATGRRGKGRRRRRRGGRAVSQAAVFCTW